MKKHIRRFCVGIAVLILTVLPKTGGLANYAENIDYDSIYNEKNYESKFDESAFLAVMRPVEWCGSVEAYAEHGVFDEIEYSAIDILSKCTEPDDDRPGDLLLIRLKEGSREKVLESIELLKNNEYVLYSFPNYGEDPDKEVDEDDNEIGLAGETPEYYLTDGVFSTVSNGTGTEIVALYKSGICVSAAIGNEISIADRDFDTLAVYKWSGTDTMVPQADKIVLSREQVMSAEPEPAQEPRYGDIPSVYLTGDTTDISKETRVILKMVYESATDKIEGYVSAKWQGNYALNFEKKNYAVKLYKDEVCDKKLKTKFLDWDKSNNYVLKANWVDSTAARNIVCARLFGTLPGAVLPSGSTGVIDGFPVRLYLNGEYRGLYTWNKPKKGWVFGMDGENENELLYFSNFAVGSGLFKSKYSADHYWELVYPDEHESSEEFDRVTGFVAACSDEEFRESIGEYIDMDSLLNYYIFAQIIMHKDGTGKNMNMATYDGSLWYMRPYDMDATFGLEWHGGKSPSYTFDMCEENLRESTLWRKLEDNFPQEIYDRYILLRNHQLSEEKVLAAFRRFFNGVGEDLYKEDLSRWSGQPSRNYGYSQIEDYVNTRYPYLDQYMKKFDLNEK